MEKMTKEQVAEEVRQAIRHQLDAHPDDITAKADIYDDLGADSLGAVELVIDLEERFELDIPDEDVEGRVTTVQQIIDYIHREVNR